MDSKIESNINLEFHPLTPERWDDFEFLFGERGACGGCWCMYWRLKRSQFNEQKGEKNKLAMKKIVKSGKIPGILAYIKNHPIAWCAFGKRETFLVLENSRILKRIDDESVWSIVCFFISKPYRRQGLSVKLLEAVVNYIREQDGKIIEGYPYDINRKTADPFVWTGLVSTFQKVGFVEIIRRSKSRPIMRLNLKQN